MEELSTEILVIGSGLAGIMAALAAEEVGVRTTLVGKFAIGMGNNSAISNGVFTASHERFSTENHQEETLKAGRGLNHAQIVRRLVDQAPEAMEKLKAWGVSLVEVPMGFMVDRSGGCDQIPGVLLMRSLKKRLGLGSIHCLPGLVVFDLVVGEGRVQGAFGFLRDGRPCLVQSKAVILAAGGGGAIYRRNDNQRSTLGDGYGLALRAGLPLLDLEFVQFYPFVLAEPGLHTFILYPPYPDGVKVMDEHGADLLERLGIEADLNRAIITRRDSLTLSLMESTRTGEVYFDLRQVPETSWKAYPLTLLERSKFPFRERPFLVAPAVHFCMGGVEIDENGRTSLPGLYAAGEVAWGLHGANRLGGNALTECAVFGRIAGRSAAEEAKQTGWTLMAEPLKKRWEKRANQYFKRKRGGAFRSSDLLKELKHLAWKFAGPIREESLLKEGLERLHTLETKIDQVSPETVKELFRKREMENGALLLKAILKGSLEREESRGAFYRRDFPERDDRQWLKNSVYSLVGEEIVVAHHPVRN
ncbi:MAG: FAD-binding protein [Desulfobacterota bacterium]|nr:FAD-binding protein [Thermodesulfobacteriota bacterium]